MKFIPTSVHAIIYYLYGITLIALSWLPIADFTATGNVILNAAGIVVLLYSMLTKYEFGFLRIIPVPVHLLLDIIFDVLLAASPWIFDILVRNTAFYVIPGVFSIIAGFVTKTKPGNNYML